MPLNESLQPAVERIERMDALRPLVGAMRSLSAPLATGDIRSKLAGEWLGHSLHPLLTDLPLGFWTSASLLDVVGGRGARKTSRRLIGLGIAASLPTAASGLSDWAHTGEQDQRVGAVHAAANVAALACYTASYAARWRGRHLRAALLGFAGATAAMAGGYLGGHLALNRAVTRDNALMPDAQPKVIVLTGSSTDDTQEMARAGS